MAKVHLGARVERAIVNRIDEFVVRGGGTKTDVIERALQVGLDRLEELELAEGFALLGDPAMQDMAFPTGAQAGANGIDS